MQVSKSELIHHRLQAMLREHSFSDLEVSWCKTR